MRFTRYNWVRFFDGHVKCTTIRLKPQRIGAHNAWAGSYMHPEFLGSFVVWDVSSKRFDHLDYLDAVNDGFQGLHELKAELKRLNASIADDTVVYINWVIKPVKGGRKI